MMKRFTRRQFIKLAGVATAGLAFFGAGCASPASEVGRRTPPDCPGRITHPF